jgi:hypothetical protein
VLRLAIGLSVLRVAVKRTIEGDILPLLLLSTSLIELIQGPFGQPTALGFAVFGTGLCLAAAKVSKAEVNGGSKAESSKQPVSARRVRGRSVYAEILHGNQSAKLSDCAAI